MRKTEKRSNNNLMVRCDICKHYYDYYTLVPDIMVSIKGEELNVCPKCIEELKRRIDNVCSG